MSGRKCPERATPWCPEAAGTPLDWKFLSLLTAAVVELRRHSPTTHYTRSSDTTAEMAIKDGLKLKVTELVGACAKLHQKPAVTICRWIGHGCDLCNFSTGLDFRWMPKHHWTVHFSRNYYSSLRHIRVISKITVENRECIILLKYFMNFK